MFNKNLFPEKVGKIGENLEKKTISLHGLAPKYIFDTLEPYEPTWTLRTAGSGLLLMPRD